ncbi:MAG: type II toxin-antitoxin system HicB family antitoxin [Chloroflexi bacterium]|nr:type II toxin-antitoxin system HicB family antitoxin [Chloroflexota bacterium]
MKTYVFKAEVEQDPSGRWGAEVPSLPGCATEGDTKEEALEALREAAQAYLEVMYKHGDPLPEEAEEEVTIISSADVVAITV